MKTLFSRRRSNFSSREDFLGIVVEEEVQV
jgi:hypothetical protein